MVRPAYDNPQDSLVFDLDSPEVIALMETDDDMRLLIQEVGEVIVDIEGDGFISLARAIVDQQISLHAARAIWLRLDALCRTQTGARDAAITPDAILALDVEDMRGVGLSRSKATYLHDLALHVREERIIFEELALLEDEQIIAALLGIKGVGRWTAQMHLIFSLGRLDVFTPVDGALRRSVCMLKGLPADAPLDLIESLAQQWAPNRTVASLYLWRGLGQGVLQSL